MEIKGIDVSRWNGVIDWPTVANYGMGFAILRITERVMLLIVHLKPIIKAVPPIVFLSVFTSIVMQSMFQKFNMKQKK